MRQHRIFQQPFIQRLSVLFLLLGLIPTIVLVFAPITYVLVRGNEGITDYLHILWAIQGGIFLSVVLIGGGITLRKLAIPIQELIAGASELAHGNLAYRVTERHGTDELKELTQNFNIMADSVQNMHDRIEEQRTMLESSLAQREREFDVILEIASLVNSTDDSSSTIARALKIARDILGTSSISLVLVNAQGKIASTSFACGDCLCDRTPCFDQCKRQRLLQRCIYRMQDNVLKEVIEDGKEFHLDDLQQDTTIQSASAREALNALGVRKMALLPLVGRGRILGAVVLMRDYVIDIPQQSLTLLDTLLQNIAVLVENRQLQDKARTLTILQERSHLARELHDSVTQSLFTLSLTARGLKSSLADTDTTTQQALDVLVDQTRTVQSEMRNLINTLRPVDLETDDLENALRQHILSLKHSSGADVKLVVHGNIRAVPKSAQQNLNRIAQEALSNIARHTNAKNVSVKLEVTTDVASLIITDDGDGFDTRTTLLTRSGTLGLTSMRERAEMLGGALLIRSVPGSGTSVTAQIPLLRELELA